MMGPYVSNYGDTASKLTRFVVATRSLQTPITHRV